MKRRVVVVSTSRADYSHLYWPLVRMLEHPELAVELIATGAHLSPEFGSTGKAIADLDVHVTEIESLLSSDTDVGMAKTIGVATLGLADALAEIRPDLLLLIADRYEILAPAAVALALRIPIAHIEGGEISEGAIDDAVRNALTKMSHLHFTPTEQARRRVIAMGEEDWRVHRTGAPSIDFLANTELLTRDQLELQLSHTLERPVHVVAYHPLTLATDTLVECDAFFAALQGLEGQVVFCFPNADAGSRAIVARARDYCAARAGAHLHINLAPRIYWSLLAHADVMLGNSSSGIMETPSLLLPCVNVGDRQRGRQRAANIIDVPAEPGAIGRGVKRALTADFRERLQGLQNPYGDGRAAEAIASLLVAAPDRDILLRKRALPLAHPASTGGRPVFGDLGAG